ncbi:MAG: agmatine deiminase family protein [Oligoflexia bacterium]|nr:agmatine deiminase family protein [Oligoflexia bacterium]
MLKDFSRRTLLGSLAATSLVGSPLLLSLSCRRRPSDAGPGGDTGSGGSNGDTGALDSTPAVDGFSVPAETDTHAGCIMQFPPPDHYCQGKTSDCTLIQSARAEWAAVAKAIAEHEPVVMYAVAEDISRVNKLCKGAVSVIEAELNDGWSRDSGPILLRNKQRQVRASCFQFNGWGGSYSYDKDALIKRTMTTDLGVQRYDQAMVLEGGAVIMDGAGTLITTESCLLHDTRNPDLSQSQQEQILREYLGVTQVIWLEQGWVPDPLTNGHVDGIAAFVSPGLVLLNSIGQAEDPTNYAILESARERLESAGLEVIRVPATSWTAFHINFYVANGAIIVPIEGRASVDDTPLAIIGNAFPGYQVVGVEANTLGKSGGGIHCITQQVPDGLSWPF